MGPVHIPITSPVCMSLSHPVQFQYHISSNTIIYLQIGWAPNGPYGNKSSFSLLKYNPFGYTPFSDTPKHHKWSIIYPIIPPLYPVYSHIFQRYPCNILVALDIYGNIWLIYGQKYAKYIKIYQNIIKYMGIYGNVWDISSPISVIGHVVMTFSSHRKNPSSTPQLPPFRPCRSAPFPFRQW